MSKVLTFSRQFPAYHPKAGQPTGFIESIVNSGVIGCPEFDTGSSIDLLKLNPNLKWQVVFEYAKTWNTTIAAFGNGKHHTIRAGHRFKAGDWFSPRVWSGQPYQSKQIIIAPPIQVKKVWDFDLMKGTDKWMLCLNGVQRERDLLLEIAQNDGLDLSDLLAWFKFPKPTTNYQIICWNEKIEY